MIFIVLSALTIFSDTLMASEQNADLERLLKLPLDSFGVTVSVSAIPPIIDGDLNDSCWAQCRPYGNFTQALPNMESAATESTLCYLVYDSDNLYFAAKCFDSEPDKVIANLKRREDIGGDDIIELMLDTYNEQRSCYTFDLNPLGIQGDGIKIVNENDDSWDGVWMSSGKRTNFGWQVEAAIPFKTLRFPQKKEQIWRVQFVRLIQRKNEGDSYVPFRKTDNNDLEQMAPLVGISSIGRDLLLDITPYLTNNHNKFAGVRDTNKVDFGADIKYGLGSSLVVDATVNPDFGQVEADIDYINLSPYKFYLQEKRPFFLERTDIFSTPFYLFYSRKIENPDIGIRATGKEGKYGFGVLYARDNNLYINNKDDYFVARCEREIMKQSSIGIMTTYVDGRDRYNATYSLDWKIKRGPFSLDGQLAKSKTKHCDDLDWKGTAGLRYYRNNLSISYDHSFYEKNFFADAGFIYPLVVDLNFTPFSYRADQIGSNYDWYINNNYIQKITPYVSYYIQHDYDGLMLARVVAPSLTFSFQKNIGMSVSYRFERSLWENRYFNKYASGVSFWANPGGHLGVSAYYQEGQDIDYWNVVSVWQKNFNFGITWNIGEKLELIPSINHVSQYEYQHGPRTYNQWNGLLRIGLHFNKDIFIKAFLQGNDYSDYYMANLLFGYTFLPGSTFYLAYNSNYVGRYIKSDSRFLFAKFSYLLAI
jgi:hypothetical protein